MHLYVLLLWLRKTINRCYKLLNNLDSWCIKRLAKTSKQSNVLKEEIIHSSINHNMMQKPDESFFARLYTHFITHELAGRSFKKSLVVDLGCGQGRLTLPLAKWAKQNNMEVKAVDISQQALDDAETLLRDSSLFDTTALHAADITNFLDQCEDNSVAVLVCTEVLYTHPNYIGAFHKMFRVLSSDGIAFVALRSRFYNTMHTITQGHWEDLPTVLQSTEGSLWKNKHLFSWNDAEGFKILLQIIGFHCLWYCGIGVCSGVEGDPHASFVRPSCLSDIEQDKLFAAELHFSRLSPDNGRYILYALEKLDA